MKKNILLLLISFFFLLGCEEKNRDEDPTIINRSTIQGEWFLNKRVIYSYSEDQIIDSTIYYRVLDLVINETDTCTKFIHAQINYLYGSKYSFKFVSPDNFLINVCPYGMLCFFDYPETYHIVNFDKNALMTVDVYVFLDQQKIRREYYIK